MSTRERLTVISYQPREGYCEGLFSQTYSNFQDIAVLGYHAGAIRLPPTTIPAVNISIKGDPSGSIDLLIQDLLESKHYQRDEKLVSPETETLWNLNIIRDTRVQLGARDIAALACEPDCSTDERWLLPVQIGEKAKSTPRFVLTVPRETRSLHWDIRDPDSQNVLWERSMSRPNFNPSTPVVLKMKPLKGLASAVVTLKAVLQDNSATLRQVRVRGLTSID